MNESLTCAPAIFKTTTERHSYASENGEMLSIFTAGKCNRQFDNPSSLIEVNVKNARIAENVVEFCGERETKQIQLNKVFNVSTN